MPKVTKIGLIRDELKRIASTEDKKDLIAPSMNASWSFTRVMVIGKIKIQTFDFDSLTEILMTIPDGAGEMQFWIDVDSIKSTGSAEEAKANLVVAQLAEYKPIQIAKA